MRMAVSKGVRNLSDVCRRWGLLTALMVLGTFYVLAFALFLTDSKDFFDARKNRNAADFAARHMLNVPVSIPLHAGSPYLSILGGGWHAAESQGVWSSSKDSWVELVLPMRSPKLLLQLDTKMFLSQRNPDTNLAIEINGKTAGVWHRDLNNASDPIVIRLREELPQKGRLSLHLHLENIASPFLMRAGRDLRPLGMLLSSISIKSDDDSDG